MVAVRLATRPDAEAGTDRADCRRHSRCRSAGWVIWVGLAPRQVSPRRPVVTQVDPRALFTIPLCHYTAIARSGWQPKVARDPLHFCRIWRSGRSGLQSVNYTTHSVKRPLPVIHTISASCRLAVRQLGVAGAMLYLGVGERGTRPGPSQEFNDSLTVPTRAGKPGEGLRHGRNMKTVIQGAKRD